MTTFTIHSGIAKPAKNALGATTKYPIAEMQVGQMMHIPFGTDDKDAVYRRAQSVRVSANKRFPDRSHSTRAVEVNGVAGVGIWRDA